MGRRTGEGAPGARVKGGTGEHVDRRASWEDGTQSPDGRSMPATGEAGKTPARDP